MGERPDALTGKSHGERDHAKDSAETDETAQIQAEIAETRAEMSDTIDAIQTQLHPERRTEQAKQTVQQATIGRVKQSLSRAGQRAQGRAQKVVTSFRSPAHRERLASGRRLVIRAIRTRRQEKLSRGGLLGLGGGLLAAIGSGLGIVWFVRRRRAERKQPVQRLRRATAEMRARAPRRDELVQSLAAREVASRMGPLSSAFALLLLGLLLGWMLRECRLQTERRAVARENLTPTPSLSVPPVPL